MLDISKPLTSGKVQSYYRTEYSSASNSYFSQGGELQGQWHGQLAPVLGLSGPVSAAAFDRLAEGMDPRTGEQLIQHRDTIKTQAGEELGHRAGWDLTFNAPKTVSLTALVGEDQRVREAHQLAVRVALGETEKYVQARLGGVRAPETTGKWIAALFEHDTARPVDGYPAPHLHTHVIVFNLTEDHSGQARSLQPYELFKIQAMATAVYQNQLEYNLRQLGYGIERGKNHAPEIKGYPPEYLAAESLRTAEIREGMEKRGVVGREAESFVKHQNREQKLHLSPDEIKALHQEKAAQFGNQPSAVMEQASEHQSRGWSAEKRESRAVAAVTHARESLSERDAVFEHSSVIRDALRHTQGRALLSDIQSELDRQVGQGKFVAVEHVRPNAPAARYTTPQLQAMEREAIETMQAGLGQPTPIADTSAAHLARRFSNLNEDQQRLVFRAVDQRDQIFGIQGSAGTGKTTVLRAIQEVARESGYQVSGLAPTSRAVKELKKSGIEAETLQARLAHPIDPAETTRPHLYFVDESSLTSAKQMRDFLQRLSGSDRVLLIGDVRQHQSIEAGRIFEQLQDAGMGVASLSQIVRQKDEGLRHAVEAMARGHVGEGVDLLAEQRRIHAILHRGERLQAIAEAYAKAPAGTLVISPDNQSRRELNQAIRAELRESGTLEADVFRLPVLINRQNVTGEDRKLASAYHVGDSVRYLRGSEALSLAAKSYATVLHVNPEHNEITVQKADGRYVTYDPARVKGVALYEPEFRSFAEGDRVQFTAPWKDRGVSNRETGTVRHLDAHGNVAVRLDDSGRTVAWNLNHHRHLDHAYAMTSHASQGVTVDRVLIHVDTGDTRIRPLIDETLAYVATSRPRYDAQIFTDNAGQLPTALSRSHQNTTALSPEQTQSYGMGV
jgi:conjugative relaxase-like TrwC/TraI family protein